MKWKGTLSGELRILSTNISIIKPYLKVSFTFQASSKDRSNQQTMAPKTAYITGGAGGIGLAVAQALNQRGMRIVVADINLSAAQEAVKRLQETSASGEKHLAVEVDVSSWESQVTAFETAIEAVKRLDIVIVNAGVGEKTFVPNDAGKGQGFVKPNLNILEVDLNGFLYTSALAIQQMRRQEPGEDGLRGRSELNLESQTSCMQLTVWIVVGTASVCGFYCVPSKYEHSRTAVQFTDQAVALPVYTAAKQ